MANLSDQQIASIVFNETRSLSGPAISEARVNIAHTIINASASSHRFPAMASAVARPRPAEKSILFACTTAVATAPGNVMSSQDPPTARSISTSAGTRSPAPSRATRSRRRSARWTTHTPRRSCPAAASMRIPTISLTIAALAAAAAMTPAGADPLPCRARQDRVGACHGVRGELQLFDGTPSARIHVAHTRRVLGVANAVEAGNETFVAPKEVRDVASFEAKLRGSFEVCPLAKSRPGRMQSVCIVGASGLVSVPLR